MCYCWCWCCWWWCWWALALWRETCDQKTCGGRTTHHDKLHAWECRCVAREWAFVRIRDHEHDVLQAESRLYTKNLSMLQVPERKKKKHTHSHTHTHTQELLLCSIRWAAKLTEKNCNIEHYWNIPSIELWTQSRTLSCRIRSRKEERKKEDHNTNF
jgi:hypothetical protein